MKVKLEQENNLDLETLKSEVENIFKDETATMRAVFDEWDSDGSGELDYGELKMVIEHLGGGALGDAELRLSMLSVDKNGDGVVTFEEFQHWWDNNSATFKTGAMSSESSEEQARDEQIKRSIDQLGRKAVHTIDNVRSLRERAFALEESISSTSVKMQALMAECRSAVR